MFLECAQQPNVKHYNPKLQGTFNFSVLNNEALGSSTQGLMKRECESEVWAGLALGVGEITDL